MSERLHSLLDNFLLHYTLGKADLNDLLETRRKELKHDLDNLKSHLKQASEASEENGMRFG